MPLGSSGGRDFAGAGVAEPHGHDLSPCCDGGSLRRLRAARRQNVDDALQALRRGPGVIDQGDADVGLSGIIARTVGFAHIGAGDDPHPGLAPQLHRRRLAVADVEPEEEAAVGLAEAEAVAQQALGDGEVLPVVGAVGLDMALLAPQTRSGGEDRQRHAGAADPQGHIQPSIRSADPAAKPQRRPGAEERLESE